MKRLILLILIQLLAIRVSSQNIQKVSAAYTYYASETVSVEDAKRTALERAKVQALADCFGTTVSQSSSTIISNKNGVSDSRFFSLGGSDVKGEWVETVGEPEYEIMFEDHFLVVKCTVNGLAKEIPSAKVDFFAKPLRNGTTLKFEATEFSDGDDLFLYFKSPIDGYLTVYLFDEVTQQSYCILPYKKSSGMAYEIKSDKEYIFFSTKDADFGEKSMVDEYSLSAENSVEYNTLCLIFSVNKYAKSKLEEQEYKPNSTDYKSFKEWITKLKRVNNDVVVSLINIKITRNG